MTHITQRLHPHCFADSEKKILHEQYVVRHWLDGGHWPPCNWRVCLLTVTLLQWRHVSITVSLNTGNSTGSSKNANNKEDFRAPYNWESTSDRWILSQRASNAEIRSGDYAWLNYKRKIFYEHWHLIPLQRMKNTIFLHTFWRPFLDWTPRLFLDPNMSGFQFIRRVLWSQILVVNWQKLLFILLPPEKICIVTKCYCVHIMMSSFV